MRGRSWQVMAAADRLWYKQGTEMAASLATDYLPAHLQGSTVCHFYPALLFWDVPSWDEMQSCGSAWHLSLPVHEGVSLLIF